MKGELPEALKLFRKVQPQFAELPRLRELSSLYIESCFEAMGDPDEQITRCFLRSGSILNVGGQAKSFGLGTILIFGGTCDVIVAKQRLQDNLYKISSWVFVPCKLSCTNSQVFLFQYSKIQASVIMGETGVKSRASLKAQLADYSQGARAQLERPGIAAGIKNWVSYSAAAVSTLAAVTAADAGVIYSGIRNVTSGPNVEGFGTIGEVDIDGKGNIEFQVIGYEDGRYGVGKIRAPLATAGINAISVYLISGDAVRFQMGQSLGTIGTAGTTGQKGSFMRIVVLGAKSGGYNWGNFQNSTIGYAGFRFNPGDGDHYGWIRLQIQDLGRGSGPNGLTDKVTAIDWAYESRINTRIIIGDTGASVPEPGSLTLVGLAMGCAAMPALRRRRQLRKAAASPAKE